MKNSPDQSNPTSEQIQRRRKVAVVTGIASILPISFGLSAAFGHSDRRFGASNVSPQALVSPAFDRMSRKQVAEGMQEPVQDTSIAGLAKARVQVALISPEDEAPDTFVNENVPPAIGNSTNAVYDSLRGYVHNQYPNGIPKGATVLLPAALVEASKLPDPNNAQNQAYYAPGDSTS